MSDFRAAGPKNAIFFEKRRVPGFPVGLSLRLPKVVPHASWPERSQNGRFLILKMTFWRALSFSDFWGAARSVTILGRSCREKRIFSCFL